MLDDKGCISNFEYSYLRPDENRVVNEFSYDIDSSYIKGSHFFSLMLECKYCHESTNWLFLPSEYGGHLEIGTSAFLHPNDHFTQEHKFPFSYNDLPPIAPICSKGIEITTDGQNPKTITQAISQLSYAMAEKIASGMEHQFEKFLGTSEIIFYDIPIIVTTANLYRLKENTTIENIKAAEEILQFATKEDCLVLDTNIGKDLERHNLGIFSRFISQYTDILLNQKLKSFNKDIKFVCNVISSTYSPSCILVIQHSSDSKGFEKLFKYMDEIVKPSKDTIDAIKKKYEKLKKMRLDIDKKIKNNKKSSQ